MESLMVVKLGEDDSAQAYVVVWWASGQYHGLIIDWGLCPSSYSGADFVLPDIIALRSLGLKIEGVIGTHMDGDHVDGIPWLYQLGGLDRNLPVYGTRETVMYLKELSKGWSSRGPARFVVMKTGKAKNIGGAKVVLVHAHHSVVGAAMVYIEVAEIRFLISGDFTMEDQTCYGPPTDVKTVQKLCGRERLDAFFFDASSVSTHSWLASSIAVCRNIASALEQTSGLAVVALRAKQVPIINGVVEKAAELGFEHICFSGPAMRRSVNLARRLGHLKLKGLTEIELREVSRYERSKVILIVTGPDGEQNSIIEKLAFGSLSVNLTAGDSLILATEINNSYFRDLIGSLKNRGVVIFTGRPYCFWGHPSEEGIAQIIEQLNPRLVVPCHGPYKTIEGIKQGLIRTSVCRRPYFTEQGWDIGRGRSIMLVPRGQWVTCKKGKEGVFIAPERRHAVGAYLQFTNDGRLVPYNLNRVSVKCRIFPARPNPVELRHKNVHIKGDVVDPLRRLVLAKLEELGSRPDWLEGLTTPQEVREKLRELIGQTLSPYVRGDFELDLSGIKVTF